MTAASKGAALGLAAFIPANWALARRFPAYRSLPLPGKAFLGLMFVVPIGTVFAEKAGEHFIVENQWRGAAYDELNREKMEAEARWNAMSMTDKAKDWAARHQYAVIGGSWVASLGIAFGIVARNKYQTFPQKVSNRAAEARSAEQSLRWEEVAMTL